MKLVQSPFCIGNRKGAQIIDGSRFLLLLKGGPQFGHLLDDDVIFIGSLFKLNVGVGLLAEGVKLSEDTCQGDVILIHRKGMEPQVNLRTVVRIADAHLVHGLKRFQVILKVSGDIFHHIKILPFDQYPFLVGTDTQ